MLVLPILGSYTPSTQGILKGNTWAKQIITTTTAINNNTVLTNVGILSTLLNAQPAIGDRFYSMIDYTESSTNKHKYIFALLEVTAVGLALFVWGYSGTTISLTSVSESKLTLIPTAIAANPVTPILMQYTGKLFPITPLAGIC